MVASEVVGFAKTGGLADVAGALPRALARRGHQCAVILPLHRSTRTAKPAPEPTDRVLRVQVGGRTLEARLWRSSFDDGKVPVWLIEQPNYFDRDDPATRHGLYQDTTPDGTKRDYDDNSERFIFFNRAVCEAIEQLDMWPDVVHVNDWQTGLIPVYLKEEYRRRSDVNVPLRYDRIRTLMTIHNIAFQGNFWHWDVPLAHLDWKLFNQHQLEFYGKLSFLKAGIVFADLINTVSPTYAREIQTPQYGSGMQAVLVAHREKLSGIVNGVDYDLWDPSIDALIPAIYDADDLSGKAECKRALLKETDLGDEEAPLLGVVARLTEQKGVDLITAIAPGLLDQNCRMVILGEGDPKYHRQLEGLRHRYPGRLWLKIGFDEALAHRIEAGADIFLMPSAYEPSGLNQLYSLRYGTPPVVRATGGLADTVTDTTEESIANKSATGFRFGPYNAHAFWEATQRALNIWRTRRELWQEIMKTGMKQDWSWDRSAVEYEQLYQRMCNS
jgi:starch synthase